MIEHRPVGPRKPARPYLQRVVPARLGLQPLTEPQKFELSLRSRIGWEALGSSFLGAGERQLFNSSPHYGTDRGAFGERLAAAETNQVVESFFSYGFYPAILHDDPHYYVMGRGHSYKRRIIYSGTRVLVTRNDSGQPAVNWPKLAGLATAAILTNIYYPARDRTAGRTANAFATSVGTSAATLELQEFLPEVIRRLFHRQQEQMQ